MRGARHDGELTLRQASDELLDERLRDEHVALAPHDECRRGYPRDLLLDSVGESGTRSRDKPQRPEHCGGGPPLSAAVVRPGHRRRCLSGRPRTVLRAARDVVGADVVADLRKIVAPTLLVWGERDLLVPPSVGRLFEREIADARLAVLERAGHVPMVERPDAFAHLVLAFLARAAG